MAAAPPTMYIKALYAYNVEHKLVTTGLYANNLQKGSTACKQWEGFCTWLWVPVDLVGIKDLGPFLHIFLEWIRTGVLAAERKTIQKQSVEQYLYSVG